MLSPDTHNRRSNQTCLPIKGLLLLLIIGVGGRIPRALAENWPQWRGPTLNGICTERDLPVAWSAAADA